MAKYVVYDLLNVGTPAVVTTCSRMLLARRCSAHVSELNRPIVAMVVVVEDIDVLREIEMNIIIVKKRFLESIFN